ncbi:hypothetical protein AMTR_s00130p00119390 [Amborella trichopoda]|uniref:Uncharacterized protein n=1 Tax=Amborella trichopoda TaxID=13333 RepID=W1NSB6_AMBTC|nr:hypothetical protein AMTR_s00130p00119390 [Amborella trichopoda]
MPLKLVLLCVVLQIKHPKQLEVAKSPLLGFDKTWLPLAKQEKKALRLNWYGKIFIPVAQDLRSTMGRILLSNLFFLLKRKKLLATHVAFL